jgi:tetratricopeptide (TPR) repeat protein
VELIPQGAASLGPSLAPLAEDEVALDEAIAILGAYSLVRRERETKTLSIHRLVQAVLKETMDEQTRQEWTERTVQAVNHAFPGVEFTTWPQCERYLSHALVCAESVQQKQIKSPEATSLLSRTGWYLTERARYSEAQPLLEQAYQISQQVQGEIHFDTARDAHALAVLYQAQGKYGEAEPLYRRALAIYEQALGPDHPFTAATLHQLAYLYQDQGKYGEAEPLYRRALAIKEQVRGPDHPSASTTLHELARLYQAQGKYGEAEPLYRRALAISEQARGPDHPDTGSTLHQLASLYQAQGKYGEAEPLYRRALA